jgi:hypothetical protein
MHFAVISPTEYLDQFSGRSHVQMCVAPWAAEYPKYFEWYKRRREQGDFVILDNGAYEGHQLSSVELIRISDELKPNVLAVPDKLNDADESQRLWDDFFEYVNTCRQFNWPAWMRVVQHESRDPEDWFELLDTISSYDWLAIPRCLGHPFRLQIAAMIKAQFTAKIHAFGWTGSIEEIRTLAKLGVTTMDSAGPVWRGLLGYPNGGAQAWPDLPFDVNAKDGFPDMMSLNEEIAHNNVTEVLRACVNL